MLTPRVSALRLTLTLAVLLAGAVPTPPLDAANALPRPNWDRALAQQTAELGVDSQRVGRWLEQVRAGDFVTLAHSLRDFAAAPAPSPPAREWTVLQFTLQLAELPDVTVPAALLEQLENWPLQTFVPHEESGALAVPLFNIPAAARGVRHALNRRAGRERASLLEHDTGAWLEAFRQSNQSARAGFLDALDHAPAARRRAIAAAALGAAAADPDMAAVAARSVLALDTADAVLELLVRGSGDSLAAVLRESALRFPADQRALLLLGAITHAPAEQASLAIAVLAPGLEGQAAVTASLLDLLADPELGASAALALSRHRDGAVATRLQEIAAAEGAAAGRAGMALSLRSLTAPSGRRR
jgi:hypothetical protein